MGNRVIDVQWQLIVIEFDYFKFIRWVLFWFGVGASIGHYLHHMIHVTMGG